MKVFWRRSRIVTSLGIAPVLITLAVVLDIILDAGRNIREGYRESCNIVRAARACW